VSQAKLELVPYLQYEKEANGVVWIRFNRPERLNACVGSGEPTGTVSKVVDYMRAADDDPDVRIIVLTGNGRAFCAGADLGNDPIEGFEKGEHFLGAAPHEGPDAARQHFLHGLTKLMRDITYIRKPTVAMVNGPAAGLGMDMALNCDIRYGCENTLFITYQQVGQIIENGGLYNLPRLAGLGRALEFAFTGFLDGKKAHEWGILNEFYPSDNLEDEVRKLCDRMLKSPPLTQWINKRIIRASLETSMETVALMTASSALILDQSEDANEARAALRERRDPRFNAR
jgi:enoyl-CoA hydratase/carnithine racemase